MLPIKRSRTRSSPGNKLALVVLTLLCAAWAFASGPGFRTQHLLEDHFEKHGRDFGAITEQQYLQMAQQLREAHPGKNILISKRPGGAFAKFDVKHGYFGAYDADGTIRTFFIPTDGIRYFNRQAIRYQSRK